MNVLILDDQQAVLDGLKAGIQWETCGVSKLFAANNTSDARRIFDQEEIHILLCDIEMPGEDGISMVKWVTENHPATINIFLTSHADFGYAHSALALGAFDYVLQPASYPDIEKVLKRAVEKYNLDHRLSRLYQYGQYIERKRSVVAENLCYDLLHGRVSGYDRFFKDLSLLNYHLSQQMTYTPVLLHILDEKILNMWGPDECQWSMENILQELIDGSGKEALLYSPSWSEYYMVFGDGDEGTVAEICKSFLSVIGRFVPYRMACYADSACPITLVHEGYGSLNSYMKNNVFLQDGFFDKAAAGAFSNNRMELTDSVYAYWKSALERDMTEVVHREVQQYLDTLAKSKKANFSTLLDFHQKLSQLFLHILSLRNQDLSKIFTEEYTYSDFSGDYQTIHDLRNAVDFIFSTLSGMQESHTSYTDQARDYVLANLNEKIQVQEIADHIGLTPDYLSRYFKKETGKSLKDFILSVKVDAAKQQLKTTGRSVSAIAMDLGYDNVSNFIQNFKKVTGMTPNEYKKKQ